MKAATIILLFVAVALSLWTFPPTHQAMAGGLALLDRRPAKRILIIGNSRTYYNGMPEMLPKMADSAGNAERLDVTVEAWGGASFEENWNSGAVQRLLKQRWDHVILQPESRAQSGAAENASFSTFGSKLIEAAVESHSPVAVVVNWGYGQELFKDYPSGSREDYISAIRASTRELVRNTSAGLIETSDVWESFMQSNPYISLYLDGNHPSVAGSYLSALMIYGFLFGEGVKKVTYYPSDLDGPQAETIRNAVIQYYYGRSGSEA